LFKEEIQIIKAGKRFYYQDVNGIEVVINGIAAFMMEGFENCLRVYGYW
jgi:hypothetical protein